MNRHQHHVELYVSLLILVGVSLLLLACYGSFRPRPATAALASRPYRAPLADPTAPTIPQETALPTPATFVPASTPMAPPIATYVYNMTCCNLPPAKATLQWAGVQTRIAYLTAFPAGTATAPPTPPLVTPRPWPTGINVGPTGLPPGYYTVVNQWQGDLAGFHYIIEAGDLTQEPAQGFVAVSAINLATNTGSDQTIYTTPVAAGAVHVTGATADRLTLQAADGTLFYFAVATRQWVTP